MDKLIGWIALAVGTLAIGGTAVIVKKKIDAKKPLEATADPVTA